MTTESPAAAAPDLEPPDPRERLLSPAHLPMVIAALCVVTLGAYENRAVTTVLPLVARELDGLQWYGLATGISSLTFLVATAVAGVLGDHRGPRALLLLGVGTFVVAQALTGLAPSMPVLLLGRATSGVAEGLLDIGLVVLVADVMPAHLRARVFAGFAVAWALPSLLGPFVAGLVAEQWGWRAVFVTPVALLALALPPLLTALRRARPRPGGRWQRADRSRVGAAVLVAAAIGTLTWGTAAWTTSTLARPTAATGLVVLVLAGRRLLPHGTATLSPGVPAAVGLRLVVSATFAATGTYLPLLLVAVHGTGPRLAGISLAITGVLWAAGSTLVSTEPVRRRTSTVQRLRIGLLLMSVGAVGPLLLALDVVGLAPAMLGWCVSALGMGVANNTLAVRTVELAPPERQGEINAAATLAAAIGVSLATAGGGALVAAQADHLTGSPFAAIVLAGALLGLLGAAASPRVGAG